MECKAGDAVRAAWAGNTGRTLCVSEQFVMTWVVVVHLELRLGLILGLRYPAQLLDCQSDVDVYGDMHGVGEGVSDTGSRVRCRVEWDDGDDSHTIVPIRYTTKTTQSTTHTCTLACTHSHAHTQAHRHIFSPLAQGVRVASCVLVCSM